jgi:hypothetical protein
LRGYWNRRDLRLQVLYVRRFLIPDRGEQGVLYRGCRRRALQSVCQPRGHVLGKSQVVHQIDANLIHCRGRESACGDWRGSLRGTDSG